MGRRTRRRRCRRTLERSLDAQSKRIQPKAGKVYGQKRGGPNTARAADVEGLHSSMAGSQRIQPTDSVVPVNGNLHSKPFFAVVLEHRAKSVEFAAGLSRLPFPLQGMGLQFRNPFLRRLCICAQVSVI